jgi:hypothetical protein
MVRSSGLRQGLRDFDFRFSTSIFFKKIVLVGTIQQREREIESRRVDKSEKSWGK